MSNVYVGSGPCPHTNFSEGSGGVFSAGQKHPGKLTVSKIRDNFHTLTKLSLNLKYGC